MEEVRARKDCATFGFAHAKAVSSIGLCVGPEIGELGWYPQVGSRVTGFGEWCWSENSPLTESDLACVQKTTFQNSVVVVVVVVVFLKNKIQ